MESAAHTTKITDESYYDGPGVIKSSICAADKTAFWGTGAHIPVCWENPSNPDYMVLVRNAVQSTWELESAVRFVDWKKCSAGQAGIHIRIADVNPASGVGKAALDGKDATLMADPAGGALEVLNQGMVLNFEFKKWPVSTACNSDAECPRGISCLDNICTTYDRPRSWFVKLTAVHEFGHALGFYHEQVKSNTPDWCTLRDENDKDLSCDSYPIDNEWDPSSVMNYCNRAWNGNGELSRIDKKAVRYFYGDPPPCSDPLTSCGGICVNTKTDYSDCGACGHKCNPGQVCIGGACLCDAPLVWCDNACVRLGTRNHCARCGDQCELGQACTRKRCVACKPCRCPDGFVAGDLSCENSNQCNQHICTAHSMNSGHNH